jgi:hypothetical protein
MPPFRGDAGRPSAGVQRDRDAVILRRIGPPGQQRRRSRPGAERQRPSAIASRAASFRALRFGAAAGGGDRGRGAALVLGDEGIAPRVVGAPQPCALVHPPVLRAVSPAPDRALLCRGQCTDGRGARRRARHRLPLQFLPWRAGLCLSKWVRRRRSARAAGLRYARAGDSAGVPPRYANLRLYGGSQSAEGELCDPLRTDAVAGGSAAAAAVSPRRFGQAAEANRPVGSKLPLAVVAARR